MAAAAACVQERKKLDFLLYFDWDAFKFYRTSCTHQYIYMDSGLVGKVGSGDQNLHD